MWGKLRGSPTFFYPATARCRWAGQNSIQQHAAGVFVRGTEYVIRSGHRNIATPSIKTATLSSSLKMDASKTLPSCRSGSGLLWTGLAAAAQANPAFAAVLGLAGLGSQRLMESPRGHDDDAKPNRTIWQLMLVAQQQDSGSLPADRRRPLGSPWTAAGQSQAGGRPGHRARAGWLQEVKCL